MKKYLPLILLLGMVFLTYVNTFWNGFTYDDREVISGSLLVKTPGLIYTLFTKEYFTTSGEATYRPIVTLTYFLEYRLWNDRPWGYHLMNLVYHLIMVSLIYLWFNGFVGKWESAGASLWFGIHPAISEAVNSIGFREDILAGIFVVSALLIHRTNQTPPTRIKSIIALILFILALLSKEIAIIFPILCILTDYFFLGKTTAKQQGKQYLAYGFVGLCYLILRFGIMANPVKEFIPYFGGSFYTALLNIPNLIWLYFQLIIYPVALNIDRYITAIKSLTDGTFWLGLVCLIGLALVVFKFQKEYRWAILWFLMALLPVLNFIPIYNPFGERYLYLPLIGITGCIAFMLQKYTLKKIAWIVFILWILALSTRTVLRNRDWRNDLTLFSSAATYPSGPRLHFNLGNQYRENGQFDKAILEYQTAIKQAPYFIQALSNLGTLYEQQGNYDGAIATFQRAIQMQPNSAQVHNGLGIVFGKINQLEPAVSELQTAILLKPDYGEAHYNLGVIYLKQKQTELAISELQTAIQLRTNLILAYDILASIYISQGKLNEAVLLFQTEMQSFPDRVEPIHNLGKIYHQLGQPVQAINLFNQVLLKNPNYLPALNDLAWLYATAKDDSIRNGTKAVAYALQASKLTKFQEANTLDTLAAAYAETGDFNLAISYQKKAILIASQEVKKDYLNRLRSYEKKMPIREPR